MIAVGSNPEGHSLTVPHSRCSCHRRPLSGTEKESLSGPKPSFLIPRRPWIRVSEWLVPAQWGHLTPILAAILSICSISSRWALAISPHSDTSSGSERIASLHIRIAPE